VILPRHSGNRGNNKGIQIPLAVAVVVSTDDDDMCAYGNDDASSITVTMAMTTRTQIHRRHLQQNDDGEMGRTTSYSSNQGSNGINGDDANNNVTTTTTTKRLRAWVSFFCSLDVIDDGCWLERRLTACVATS
jgi:hypothetical protein